MTIKITRRRAVVALAVLALAAGATVAVAAWLTSANGQGGARAGSIAAPTLAAASTLTGSTCLPGNQCDLEITVTNPNDGALVLTAIGANIATNGTDPAPGCPNTAMTIGGSPGLSIPIPSGVTDITVPNGAFLNPTAPTQCQGQTFLKGIHGEFSTP